MKLQIETFHGCNARCTMCTINRWSRPKGQMNDILFHRISEQAVDLIPELKVVSLYMDGEPLLDKDIAARVAHCKRIGLPHVGFSSNGSLITESKAQSLLESGMDWIAISLDSMDSSSYESIRTRLHHDVVVDNVHALIRTRNDINPKMEIALRYLDFPDNKQTFAEYKEYWQKFLNDSDKIVCSPFHNWGEGSGAEELNSTPCYHVFNNMVVLSNGTVPMCCVDYNADIPMGSVLDSSLYEIWNGDAYSDIRSLHQSGKRSSIPKCRACTVA